MRITIVGSGVIGQATGVGLHHHGHEPIFFDIDDGKLNFLKMNGFAVSYHLDEAVDKSEVIFLCVPTPTINGKMEFKYIKTASENIGRSLKKTSSYKIVVVKSTVLPSTTRVRVLPILEEYSGKKVGADMGLCMNPEFLTEKNALQDFLNPGRTIIGEYDKKSGDKVEELYKTFEAPIIRTSLENAEMIKYASNIFLAAKISYFNEIHLICEELGLDSKVISEGVSLDPRIGKYGVYGGRPFGGNCLPKDLDSFLSYLEERKIEASMIKHVQRINKEMEMRPAPR
jgi:UDPglucose 6-dehydrogenase